MQHVSWESCFYVNVPVGAAALIMSLLVLRETPPSPAASSFDIPGIAALSGALFLLIWGLIKGSSYGWGSARTMAFLAGALVVGLLFVLREHRARQPLLPLRLFRSASLSAGTGARRAADVRAVRRHVLHDLLPGERARPGPGGDGRAAAADDRDADRRRPAGRRWRSAGSARGCPIVAGMTLAAVALFGLSRLGAASSPNDTIVWFLLLGLGLSPVMVGATDVIVGNAPVALAGVAGGLQSTAMQVGGTLGTAVLGAVMSARISSLLPASWARRPPAGAERGPAGRGRRARSRWARRR